MTEFSPLSYMDGMGEHLRHLDERRWLVRRYTVTNSGQVSLPVQALTRWEAKGVSSEVLMVNFSGLVAVLPEHSSTNDPRMADQMTQDELWRRNVTQSGQLTLPSELREQWHIEGRGRVDIVDLGTDPVAVLPEDLLHNRIKQRLQNLPSEQADTIANEATGSYHASEHSLLRLAMAELIIREALPEIYG